MTTVEVVPLVRLPRSVNQIYTYSWHTPLKAGQIVVIEWRRQKVLGVVVESHSTKARPLKLKSIVGLSALGHLTSSQLILVETLQASYAASPTLAYITVVGRLPVQVKVHDLVSSGESTKTGVRSAKPWGQPGINHFVGWPGAADPIWTNILNSARTKGQVLCLFPDKYTLNQVAANWRKNLNVELWGDTNLQDRAALWHRIKSGQSDILLGNRSAVFAPFQKIKTIIFFDANDENFRAVDEQPHYDARELAGKLGKDVSCNFIEWGPSIIGQKDKFYLGQPAGARLDVNFRDDLPPTLRSNIVTPQLESDLAQTKNWSLCLINKLGQGVVICRDCQFIVACPQCQRRLIDHGEVLLCSWCALRVSKPEICTNCASPRLATIGIGLSNFTGELRKVFPDRLVLNIDAKLTREENRLNGIFSQIQKNPNVIVVGTRAILPYLEQLPKPELIALIQPEAWLSHSGWNINAQLWDLLGRATALASKRVVMDTNYIDRSMINLILRGDLRDWLSQEKKFRHQFGYPPFVRLIVITGSKLKQEIFDHIGNTAKLISYTKERAILKVEPDEDLRTLIKDFPGDWKIDINPPDVA
jgi:primosomal protein N'